jgi:hypothetical protein
MATAIQSLDSLFVHLSLTVDPQITVVRHALDSISGGQIPRSLLRLFEWHARQWACRVRAGVC